MTSSPLPSRNPFGLYIHWPFCVSKCPYCDFNSHVRAQIDIQAWEAAYLTALKNFHTKTSHQRVTSIFFGGGTPSLMPPALVEKILNEIFRLWSIDPHVEITLEANPNSVEVDHFQSLAQAGVNRVSIGVQSFNTKHLAFLGRTHSVREAERAIETAQKFFERYSFDLIYTLPEQQLEEWEKGLEWALSRFQPQHLSLYQLTIEPQTHFEKLYRLGRLDLPSDSLSATFYEKTCALMADMGLPAYEISNYAADNQACQHNLVYWRYNDYAGIGPGAHSRLTIEGHKHAIASHRAPEAWLALVKENGTGINRDTPLNTQIASQEFLLMNLRLREGFSIETWEDTFKCPLQTIVSEKKRNCLMQEGYLKEDEKRLALTLEGRLRLNRILDYLLNT